MKSHPSIWKITLATLLSLTVFLVSPVLATQTHGEPEGLVAHQLAHLFFIISMGVFAFWLRRHRLTASSGWRLIQYAALLLILWNLDAMAVHFLDEQTHLLNVTQVDTWHIRIETLPGYEPIGSWYYLFKLDHLFSVPALVLLYLGLRKLATDAQLFPRRKRRSL